MSRKPTCPNCGHLIEYHGKQGCNEGDRSWTCGCRDTRFRVANLTPKEREIYERGRAAGKRGWLPEVDGQ